MLRKQLNFDACMEKTILDLFHLPHSIIILPVIDFVDTFSSAIREPVVAERFVFNLNSIKQLIRKAEWYNRFNDIQSFVLPNKFEFLQPIDFSVV